MKKYDLPVYDISRTSEWAINDGSTLVLIFPSVSHLESLTIMFRFDDVVEYLMEVNMDRLASGDISDQLKVTIASPGIQSTFPAVKMISSLPWYLDFVVRIEKGVEGSITTYINNQFLASHEPHSGARLSTINGVLVFGTNYQGNNNDGKLLLAIFDNTETEQGEAFAKEARPQKTDFVQGSISAGRPKRRWSWRWW